MPPRGAALAKMHDSIHTGTYALLLLVGVLGHVTFEQWLLFRFDRSVRLPLWLASLCALGAVFVLGRFVQFMASTPSAGVSADRIEFAAAAGIAGLSLGITQMLGPHVRPTRLAQFWLVIGVAIALLVCATQAIVAPGAELRIDLLGRRYFESRPGPWQPIALVYFFVTCVLSVRELLRAARHGDASRRRWLTITAWVLAPITINEVLHTSRIVTTVNLLELGLVYAAVAAHVMTSSRQHLALAAREASDRAERSLLALMQSSTDAVLVHRGGRVVFANAAAAALLGRSGAGAVVGLSTQELVPAHDADGARAFGGSDALVRSKGRQRMLRADGTTVLVDLVSLATVMDDQPSVVTIARATHDEQREQLRSRFLEEVLTAQDEERRRIARELHDEAGQSLTRVLLGIRELVQADIPDDVRKRLGMLHEVAQLTLDELGRLARGLHPQLLEHLGFTAAIERFAAELGEQHGIKVDVEVIDRESRPIPQAMATALYRVVQEALTNAIRHGHADAVSIVLRRDAQGMRITIEDDGEGFDPEATSSASTAHGLGLHGIRERLALLGGTLEIESAPGTGTTLIAVVPREVS